MTSRLKKIGDAFSQLANVALLPRHEETNANESISGRAFRSGWTKLQERIDWLFSRWEKNHCEASYLMDVSRAQKTLDEHLARQTAGQREDEK